MLLLLLLYIIIILVIHVVCRCVEILITEQFRRYKEKMQNIQELEYAEALAVHQLKLRRQNTVFHLPTLTPHLSNILFIKWYTKSIYHNCST